MVMEAVWKTVCGELQVAYGNDFERQIYHFLRVIWPQLIRPTSLQQLDRYGIDLCTADKPLYHSVIVQAKGFRAEESLNQDQVTRQILPSIRKFIDSPVHCDTYLLVHNRHGDSKEIRDQIGAELEKVISTGSAKAAYLWDLSKTIKELKSRLDAVFREKLRLLSGHMSERHHEMFFFGSTFLEKVPLRTFSWNTEQSLPPMVNRPDYKNFSAAGLIASPRRSRFSILIGSFGVGKTTSILQAASKKKLELIYIRASSIERKEGSQGTNFLMRNVGRTLDLLSDLPPDTSQELDSVIGVVLAKILRQADDNFVLVIDGLDEHPFYSTPKGLLWLTNELAELRCPIVLTTRIEHFEHLSGNYRVAASSLSKKGGARRSVEVVELGSWSTEHALSFLDLITPIADADLSESIFNLKSKLRENPDDGYSDLGSHPLFLNMTLDLFVSGISEALEDPTELVDTWIKKKIERDLMSPRLPGNKSFDIDDFVHGMIHAMRIIANNSKRIENAEIVYDDEFELDKSLSIAREHTGYQEMDVPSFLSTSLFVPVETPRGVPKKVRFFHRYIQEHLAT